MYKTLNNQPMATKDSANNENENKLSLNKSTSMFVGHSFLKLAKVNATKKFKKNHTFISPYLCKNFI